MTPAHFITGKTTKITIWEHRVSVLQALGLLSERAKVTANAEACAEGVIDGLLTYVKKEGMCLSVPVYRDVPFS